MATSVYPIVTIKNQENHLNITLELLLDNINRNCSVQR